MKKLLLILSLFFLTACSKTMEDIEVGMTPKEVHEIMGEPDIVHNRPLVVSTKANLIVDNHLAALGDEDHMINNNDEFRKDAHLKITKVGMIPARLESGEYVEVENYTVDGHSVYAFYVENELFVLDDVSHEMLPEIE